MEVERETRSSLAWFSASKKLQEILLTWKWWVVTVVFFLLGEAMVLFVNVNESKDPYSAGRYFGQVIATWPWHVPLDRELDGMADQDQEYSFKNFHSVDGQHMDEDDGYFIWQTSIQGKEPVNRFQAHLTCLSEAGHWVYDPRPRKLPWGNGWYNCDAEKHGGVYGEMADAIALRNDSDAYGNWSVREELKWVWQTNDSSCPWHPVDRDDFCRRIGSNRNVLVVGDSINDEISLSMVNFLAMNSSSVAHQEINRGDELCTDVLGGVGKGFTVQFVRNDHLSLGSHPVENNPASNTLEGWMPRLETGYFKILLLNRGAHYMDDDVLVEGLRTTFYYLHHAHPELLVIFRNTIPGHENCNDYHAPRERRPEDDLHPEWNWVNFHRQNIIAKSIVNEFHYMYLDVERAISMRPDGHLNVGDCLHYCIPGPLDHVVEMLYNALYLLD